MNYLKKILWKILKEKININIFFNEIIQQIKMNEIQFDVITKITKIKSKKISNMNIIQMYH